MSVPSVALSHYPLSAQSVRSAELKTNPDDQAEQANGTRKNKVNEAGSDKVSISQEAQSKAQETNHSNADDELSPEQAQQVQQLKQRDAEVRAHEQAHAAVGGQYAGAPRYDYQQGPDGKRYAVGGEVSIDVSEEDDPKATIQKMQIVQRAALAPAEPSPQDYKVAAEAAQKEQAARAELNTISSESSKDLKLRAYQQVGSESLEGSVSVKA